MTVATSDGLEQIIIRGEGCRLLSARDLERDVEYVRQRVKTEYIEQQDREDNSLLGRLSEESKRQIGIEEVRKDKVDQEEKESKTKGK